LPVVLDRLADFLRTEVAGTYDRHMADSVDEMSHEVFVTYIPLGVLTDDEIAAKIGTYPRVTSPKIKLELTQAIQKLKGGGPVSGPLRSALRGLSGLPPVPGDWRAPNGCVMVASDGSYRA
jgi:hypothetical protein